MKLLRAFNGLLFALSVTFALTLGVVSLMYVVNLDTAPRVRAEWPTVAQTTAMFWALGVFSGLAWWSQRRALSWRWIAQALSLIVLIGAIFFFDRVL
ncbi:MAG TPA: hypothetical protein VGE51_16520 [Fontimonas sp.]